MASVRAGDDLAFERLYTRYQARIAAYVHGMVHDHGRAEDITQEVFMSALRRMRATERPIVFKPWIYEIAKNACIDAFRRSKRAEEISYDAEEGLGSADHGRLVSSTPTPDAAVDTRMSLDHLRGAFGGLSEMHHDILVMRELEGLSYREIGQRLGMSRASVESTLFRARRRLSEEYEELTSGERCKRVHDLIGETGGRRMGVRDERKLARHVSYCQPCRRAAYAAGLDVAALAAKKSLRDKVAALLPVPAFFKRRWFGGEGGGSVSRLTSAASQYAEPMSGWAKVAAVAATVAVAGAGAGVATTHGTDRNAEPPAQAPAGAGLQPASAPKQAAGTRSTAARTSGSRAVTTTSKRGPAAARRAGAGARAAAGSAAAKKPASSSSGGPAAKGGGAASGAASRAGGSSSKAAGGSGGVADGARKAAGQVSGTAGNAVDKTAKAVTTTVDKTAGAVNTTVDKTAGAVGDTVNKTAGAVNTVVGAATGAVDNATNGASAPATGAVNGAVGAATDAASGAASTAAGAVSGAASTVTGAAADPVGTVTGAASDPVGAVTGAAGGVLPGG